MRTATEPGRLQGTAERLERGASFPTWLRVGFWACIVIAVAAVVRRAVVLASPAGNSGPPQMTALDAWFRMHAALTWAHILCALALVALLPFVMRSGRGVSPGLERAFFLLGVTTGVTAYAMSANAVGGWVERSAVLFFDTLFLVSLARAYAMGRRGDRMQKRRWMVRAVAILLGIATTRPVMGVFFATSPMTHWTTRQFFGVAFWIGFSINTLAIEFWLRSTAAGRRLA